MARKRMIDPSFWTDATMVAMPFEARLLFIGMWNFADDYGYLNDEPERLALQVLPSDDVDVELLVDLLVAAGRVERYETPEGRPFLFIPHFQDYQKVDHPAKPTFPAVSCCEKMAIPLATRRQVAVKYGCKSGERIEAACYYCGAPGRICWWPGVKGRPGSWVSFSGLELDHFEPESRGGASDPENIILACRTCNRSKRDRNGVEYVSRSLASAHEDTSPARDISPKSRSQVRLEESSASQDRVSASADTNARASTSRRQPEDMAAFEPLLFAKLWGFYGKIGGCDQAAREWDKLSPDRALMQQIRQAIDDQRAAYGWGEPGGQAQPHLSTWLHGRRWEWEAVPNKVERAR